MSDHSLEELQDMKIKANTNPDSAAVSEIVNAVLYAAIAYVTSPDAFKALRIIEHFASGISSKQRDVIA